MAESSGSEISNTWVQTLLHHYMALYELFYLLQWLCWGVTQFRVAGKSDSDRVKCENKVKKAKQVLIHSETEWPPT